MSPHPLASQLSQFETQLALLSAALVRNNTDEMLAASAELHALSVVFSKVLQQAAASIRQSPPAQLRIKKIAANLSSVRQGLIRHSVMVERALAALVPATQNNTYAPSTGAYGRKPYGSAGRQSGEFKALSA